MKERLSGGESFVSFWVSGKKLEGGIAALHGAPSTRGDKGEKGLVTKRNLRI